MSENENQPPTPSKQTSSVPLKKETVRVTLKAADAPAVPSATIPTAPPVRPPAPSAPPTPTAPAAGPPKPSAPAPTIPLRTAGAPTAGAAAPAPTIRLATSTAPIGTAPAAAQPAGTPTLPKATVQLQAPTQPLGTTPPAASSSPSQAATLQMDDDEDDVEEHDGVVKILAGVGLAAAIALLGVQLALASVWIDADPSDGGWSLLIK